MKTETKFQKMTNNNAIINFMYFGYNYNHDFIEKVWSDDKWLVKHLREKFNNSYKYYQTMTIFIWFSELDRGNQNKLIDWIQENYLAFENLK